jgi:hypothetical protein
MNPRLVKHLIDGYRPSREDTIKRCGVLSDIPQPFIFEEPARRVLTGGWMLNGRWVTPEEYYGKL